MTEETLKANLRKIITTTDGNDLEEVEIVIEHILSQISQYESEKQQELVSILEKEKDASIGNCKTCGGHFPCVHQDMYFQGIDRAIEKVRGK